MTTAMVKPVVEASITLTDPVIIDPETVLYTQGFETDSAGWSSTTLTLSRVGIVSGWSPRTGSYQLGVALTGPGFSGTIRRTFTGLTVGRRYRIRGYANRDNPAKRARAGVDDVGAGAVVSWVGTGGRQWKVVEYDFTAAATSHTIWFDSYLSGASSGTSGNDFWDDITLTALAVYDTDDEVPLDAGKITMDDSWSPFVQAVVELPLTGPATMELVDPRVDQRMFIDATEEVGGSSQRFDLGVRARTIDYKEGKVTVQLASDEALLIDLKYLAGVPLQTPMAYSSSLRSLIAWMLSDQFGFTLEAGSTDADLTPAWPRENLFPDPSLAAATYITAATGASAVQTSATVGAAPGTRGSASVRWTAAAGDSNVVFGDGVEFISVTPGHTYTVSAFLRSSASRSAYLVQRFYSQKGKLLRTVVGDAQNTSTSSWTRYFVTGRAPRNAAYMHPYVTTKSNTSGQFHYVDGILAEEADGPDPFFDGGLTATSLYTYEWEDATNDSVSIATPVVERPRELFFWKPGVSLWDFLQPLVEASGLRLFCDASRKWWLIDPETYSVPGTVTAAEQVNAVEGEDVIDRNVEGLWADAVVICYRWTNAYGIEREKFDYAGTAGKVYSVTYDSEYPGPGAAAALLARMTGRGRQRNVKTLVDYTAQPWMNITIALPGTTEQTGTISQVIFDLQTGLMDLRTRDLTEV